MRCLQCCKCCSAIIYHMLSLRSSPRSFMSLGAETQIMSFSALGDLLKIHTPNQQFIKYFFVQTIGMRKRVQCVKNGFVGQQTVHASLCRTIDFYLHEPCFTKRWSMLFPWPVNSFNVWTGVYIGMVCVSSVHLGEFPVSLKWNNFHEGVKLIEMLLWLLPKKWNCVI